MITDKKFQHKLDDYLNERLSEKRKIAFEKKLARHPDWQREVEISRQYLQELKSIDHRTHHPEAATRIRQAALAAFHRHRRPRLRPSRLVATLATLMVLLLAGLYFRADHQANSLPQLAVATVEPTIQVVIPTDDPDIAIYWTYETEPRLRTP